VPAGVPGQVRHVGSPATRDRASIQFMTTDASTDDGPEIKYTIDGHVAILTFNRPERMNTISGPMLALLSELLLKADRDKDVRCVIITGDGRAWCAGLDIKAQSEGTGLLSSSGIGELDLRDAPPTVLHNMDTPTIAALNGGAAGYGMDLALGCDIRIASTNAKLAPAFTKRGIVPESGGTWLLPRIVGYAKAAEISFTGRTLVAQECLELGLVNHVVESEDLMKSAMDMAISIAENAPLAVRATKRMMRMGETETFEQNVHHVFLQLLPLFRTKDFQEGMASYLERRPPNFEGR
jgi:enoyl-CoA hydratase/carnithine racemase